MLPREAYASRAKVFAPLSALRVFFKKRAGSGAGPRRVQGGALAGFGVEPRRVRGRALAGFGAAPRRYVLRRFSLRRGGECATLEETDRARD